MPDVGTGTRLAKAERHAANGASHVARRAEVVERLHAAGAANLPPRRLAPSALCRALLRRSPPPRADGTIVDREGLRAASCECHGTIAGGSDRLVGGDG